MRDFQRPEPCPRCTTRNVAVLHSTTSALYLACRACDHTWHIDAGGLDPFRRQTSPAFRMTARVVANPAMRMSVGESLRPCA